MITIEEIKELSNLQVGDNAFLTVYASGPKARDKLVKQYERLHQAFHKKEADKDEREYFEANVDRIRDYFDKERDAKQKDTVAIFVCDAIDYFKMIHLHKTAENLLWVDSSPYIRPLLEDHADYENIAVVVADNKKARIFLVSAEKAISENVIGGNVKNHVRKGGWSQQRYERRRDKQLHHYAADIADVLQKIHQESKISRLMLFGSKETIRSVAEIIPKRYQDYVYQIPMDINRPDGALINELIPYYRNAREDSVHEVFDRIKIECLRDGLGAHGLEAVFEAAGQARVETAIIDREFRPDGWRCKSCESVWHKEGPTCPACDSIEIFKVDMVNELSQKLEQTDARVLFTGQIPLLKQVGGVVALLRYKI